jgi:hypothetical protein
LGVFAEGDEAQPAARFEGVRYWEERGKGLLPRGEKE